MSIQFDLYMQEVLKPMSIVFFAFLVSSNLTAQCPSILPSGVFDAKDDIMITTYHSSMARTPDGYIAWGEDMDSDGSNATSMQLVSAANGYNYSGDIAHFAVSGNSGAQGFLLTTTGLYVWGEEGESMPSSFTSGKAFAEISLPTGVLASDVIDLFATSDAFALVTSVGHVWIASVKTAVFGNSNSSTSNWQQVETSAGVPLSGVFHVTGCKAAMYAIDDNGDLWAWGDNVFLGGGANGADLDYATAMVAPPSPPTYISAFFNDSADDHGVLALTSDTRIYGIGSNTSEKVITETTSDVTSWTAITTDGTTPIENVLQIATNHTSEQYASAAAIVQGENSGDPNVLYTWGSNDEGNIGHGSESTVQYPSVPDGYTVGTSDATYVSVGGHATTIYNRENSSICFTGHVTDGSDGGLTTGSDDTQFECITTLDFELCGVNTCTTPPTMAVKDITLELSGGNVTLTPSDMDNGSADACPGPQPLTFTASKTTFTCADIGTNTVTLTATDVNGNQNTATATLTIADSGASCGDSTPPTITSGPSGTNLPENSGSGQTVYTISATDDVAATSYAIGGTDAALLSVVSSTGVVTLTADPDYETKNSYSFTVTASDAENNTSPATSVTFSITNVDDIVPTITSGTSGTNLAENSGAGQTIYTITANANDGGTIQSYTIAGTDASDLNVNATTGVVTLTADPDYETKNSYSFTVTATDEEGTSDPTTVTMSVTLIATDTLIVCDGADDLVIDLDTVHSLTGSWTYTIDSNISGFASGSINGTELTIDFSGTGTDSARIDISGTSGTDSGTFEFLVIESGYPYYTGFESVGVINPADSVGGNRFTFENGYDVPLTVHYYDHVVWSELSSSILGFAPYGLQQDALTDSTGHFVRMPSKDFWVYGYTNTYGCFNPEPATSGTPSASPRLRPVVIPYIIEDED